MAKKDTISYHIGGGMTAKEPCTNLTFSVGMDGDNGGADIMLVQALFNFVGWAKGTSRNLLGFEKSAMPRITGRMNSKTQQAIFNFQRRNVNKVLKIDGLMEPGKYENRVLTIGGRLMTITLLDLYAKQEGLAQNEPDHIKGVIKLAPALAPWLV